MSRVAFAGLQLVTAPGRVMTPRPRSAALVERAVAHVGDKPALVADVGTGSGAIAVAIALRAPRATIWATDVSEVAIELARANAEEHGVADRVHVRCGDLLDPVEAPVDVIVANLPYLPWRDRHAHPELAAEPRHAVFALGDGLGHYRRLLETAADRLTPGGLVAVQLHGDVFSATAEELPAMTATLVERAA
jgi:release factor glutamine methyltransferase